MAQFRMTYRKRKGPLHDNIKRLRARINFALDREPDTPVSIAKIVGITAAKIHIMLPTLLLWATILSSIFGGCCSNVFALESIIKDEPDSGLLITCVQFVITTLLAWPGQLSPRRFPFFLKPRAVPLIRWLPSVLMFFAVNLLNNFAFGYNISVPVHIILRSGGSVMTMLVGYVWGKHYSGVQISSVAMLTIGVIIAAMADAQSKGKTSSSSSLMIKPDPEMLTGLLILFLAQLISAIMGLYVQLTYQKYGNHWHENLFYSHALSLPLFLPFRTSLMTQLRQLLSSNPIVLSPSLPELSTISSSIGGSLQLSPISLESSPLFTLSMPKQIITLAANAFTQYACIRGVSLLAGRTSAIGVTIVLNIRKLISLFISIWLFGNQLPIGVMIGAVMVFVSAGVWAVEGQRLSRTSERGRKITEGSEKRRRVTKTNEKGPEAVKANGHRKKRQ